MKAISIKQPWASLIGARIKPIENRRWRTNFRGRVFIHASAPKKFNVQLDDEQTKAAMPVLKTAFDGTMPFGAIIGEVDIIDCVIGHASIWAEKAAPGEKPIWNWVLANAVLYEKPIPNIKGKLSFWEPDECLTECIACSDYLRLDDTVEDAGGNYYHDHCYNEMAPTMNAEYEEMKRKGEIDDE